MPRTRPFVVHEEDCPVEGWDDERPGSVRWRTLVSGDRTPTAALTVGVAEVQPGAAEDFRAHRHAPPEVYYILAGEGVVEIDGTDHLVRPGSTVFVPGHSLHGARNTGRETHRILYAFPTDSFDQVHYEFPER